MLTQIDHKSCPSPWLADASEVVKEWESEFENGNLAAEFICKKADFQKACKRPTWPGTQTVLKNWEWQKGVTPSLPWPMRVRAHLLDRRSQRDKKNQLLNREGAYL